MMRRDRVIRRLLQADPNTYDRHASIKLDPTDIGCVIMEAIKVFQSESTVLRISSPVTIIGDLHGQFYDLLQYFCIGGLPPCRNYLFLGDYVDRGRNSVETMALLLALKIKYPQNVWLLRGNHETAELSKIYGFFDECVEKYSAQLWDKFVRLFDWLPIAAIIKDRIFCVHGGLSPDLRCVGEVDALERPLQVHDQGLLTDLLWSDPIMESGFHPSERGTSFTFGPDVARAFLENNDLDLLCRAHQVVDTGFQFPFSPDQTVITVFSAPDYCESFGNKGAMMIVDEELHCTFSFVEPHKTRTLQPSFDNRCFFRTIEEAA